MAERFLFQDELRDGLATLVGDQAHHLTRVMRAQVGDKLVLFDGQGKEHDATIVEISKNSTNLKIDETRNCADPNFPEISVAVALPKGDRQKFLVEKLVELGANRLIPLKTQRGVAEASEKVLQRIRKQVIEATKQCRRSWLMKVMPESNVGALLEDYSDFNGKKIVADPYNKSQSTSVGSDGCIIAIGPEGGFTNSELSEFEDHGWQKVCYSPNVLRIETAATAAVAITRVSSFSASRS